jgi:hypothetical protein
MKNTTMEVLDRLQKRIEAMDFLDEASACENWVLMLLLQTAWINLSIIG